MLAHVFLVVLILSTLLNTSTSSLDFRQINQQQILLLIWRVTSKMPNSECKNLFLSTENQNKMWLLSMLDATAKPQAGLSMGNLVHIGNFVQCLEIDEKVDSKRIQGKYCSAFYQPHPVYGKELSSAITTFMGNLIQTESADEFRSSYGFCVPQVCTQENLQNFVDLLEHEVQSPVHFTFDDKHCSVVGGRPFTTSAIVGIVVFSSFAAMLLLSTSYDILFCRKDQQNVWTAFSVVRNGRNLLSGSSSGGNFNCLNGLRVISMMWIILGHEVQYSVFLPHINLLKLLEIRNKIEDAPLIANVMAVDTFFTIGGLLVVYLFMKSRDKNIAFSLPLFYLHRILRLMPSLLMLIIFYKTLLNYMGSGPLWDTDELIKPCENNWWSTLLYLQNYIHPSEQCVSHAWYLAVDTQMYFLSPLILFPLMKWPKRTIGAIIVIVVLSCAYVFEITWKKQLGTTYFNQDIEHFKLVYIPTHVRGTAYLIGMICGYLVYKTQTRRLKLSKVTAAVVWIVALSILAAIVLAHWLLAKNKEYDVLASSCFNSLFRIGWSISVSIIILLCLNGYGGFINTFLSLRIFTVLIALNYNVYLLHFPLIKIQLARTQTSTFYSEMTGYYNFWGDYVLSLVASFIWTLAFEAPVRIIEKKIFGKDVSTASRQTNVELRNSKTVDDSVSIQMGANVLHKCE